MVKMATLETLSALEREMARAGRSEEQRALQEALAAFARPEHGFITTGAAAARLRMSIPTVKRWMARGALAGRAVGGRWLVSVESVDEVVRLREALRVLDREDNPTGEELLELYGHPAPTPPGRDDA